MFVFVVHVQAKLSLSETMADVLSIMASKCHQHVWVLYPGCANDIPAREASDQSHNM